jgi:hypothetical protein
VSGSHSENTFAFDPPLQAQRNEVPQQQAP